MKKYNNRELAHIWANQKAESGQGSNMFFEGSIIYSYGHHFRIAELIHEKKIVLFNSKGYSKTTSKHKSYVMRAIPSYYTVIESPGCTNDPHLIIPYYIDLVTANIDKAATARKAETQEWCLNNANSILITLDDYIKAFNIKVRDFKGLKALLNQKGNLLTVEIKEKIKERKQAEKLATIEKNKKEISEWLNNEREWISNSIGSIFLRVITLDLEKYVETSKGAKVLLKSAKVLYKLIKAGKDIKGYQIDGYTVIGINGSLKIGCHEIDTKEIERFAKSQNW